MDHREGVLLGRVVIERRLTDLGGDEGDVIYAWSETSEGSGQGLAIIEALGMIELARGVFISDIPIRGVD